MVPLRRFGLVDAGWPAHRQGGGAGAGRRQRRGDAELRFRRGLAAAPAPRPPVTPVSLSVANLVLAPRFEMIWQSWRVAAERLETSERQIDRVLRMDHRDIRRDRVLLRDGAAPGMRTLVERAPRMVAQPARPAADGEATRGLNPPRTERRTVGIEHRRLRTSAEHVAHRFETRETERMRALVTTLAQRRLDVLDGRTARRDLAGAAEGASASHPFARNAASAAPDPELTYHRPEPVPAAGAQPPVRAPAARQPAAERTYQAEKSPVPAAPQPLAAPAPAPAPAAAPLDLATLDRELWSRFEKRIRIEQERRGRR